MAVLDQPGIDRDHYLVRASGIISLELLIDRAWLRLHFGIAKTQEHIGNYAHALPSLFRRERAHGARAVELHIPSANE